MSDSGASSRRLPRQYQTRPHIQNSDSEAGSLSKLILVRGGHVTALGSKVTNMRVEKGDIIRLETSGGGGFGPPTERDRGAIADDVRQGYVTAEAARTVYGFAGA